MAIEITTAQPKTETEWLRARLRGIGASESSAIVGMNPYMSNVDLWRIKTGRKQAEDISNKACVQYGHNAEGPIRELFALDYADTYEVSYGGAFDMVRHPEYPWLFATLDGRLVEKATGRKGVLEIKTTDILRSMQKEKWRDGVPQNYYCQLLWQLLATGFDFAVLHAQLKYNYVDSRLGIRSERRTYLVERTEVAADLDYMETEGIKFWGYVERDECPGLLLPEF